MIKTIYYADDDKDDLSLFEAAIEELGHNVKLFDLVPALLKMMELPPPPDVVFLDLNMPVMGGIDALKIIRKDSRYDKTPVVIYSTSGSRQDIEQAKNYGANCYIKKSLSFAGIRKSIAKVLSSGSCTDTDNKSEFYIE